MKKIVLFLLLLLPAQTVAQIEGIEPSADVLQPAQQSVPERGTSDPNFQIQNQDPLQPAANREQFSQYLSVDGVAGSPGTDAPAEQSEWPWLVLAVAAAAFGGAVAYCSVKAGNSTKSRPKS